jgi:SpoIID/LytB domain protein
VELQVGIVQRFGSQTTKPLTLQAQSGDRLTVRFLTDGKPQTLSASTARLEIVMQPLTEPQLEERLVLSTHRSFETAEDTAQRWQAQGIPVEVGQPGRWQVWAQRSVYNDPLLRRLLLKNLQSQGIQTAFLDTQMVKQRPKAALVLNGYRYLRDQIDISSGRGVIQVGPVAGESWRLYAGSLRLQRNAYGTYTLVNQVPLEAYLRGVVPYEIGTWAPQSVLEAQAILARTYALRNLRRFAIDNYQLCADTQCQVYNGLNGAHPATDRAIAATRGKVLTYQNELVDAVYSSTTGGVTASFTDVWQGQPRPYLQSIIDSTTSPWDLGRKSLADEANFQTFIRKTKGFNEEGQRLFRWQEVARLPQLKQELQDYLKSRKHPLAGFGSIQQMVVTERSPAGRVQKLQIITDQGPIELKKDDIRVAFSAPYSTLFYLEPLYDQKRKLNGYAFVGGGFGHGVGLSQTGSYRLGELGWSSDRILRFYFPGTAIQPLNSSIVFWQAPPVPVANPLQLSSK